jgi:hypothetical protein
MKKLVLAVIILVLSGCSGLLPGGTTPVQSVGNGAYMVQGYKTQDAIDEANRYCSSIGKGFVMINLIPSTKETRATLTYSCN